MRQRTADSKTEEELEIQHENVTETRDIKIFNYECYSSY